MQRAVITDYWLFFGKNFFNKKVFFNKKKTYLAYYAVHLVFKILRRLHYKDFI